MNQNAVLRLYALLWGVVFFGFAQAAETPDLYFTEIHHCPAEPEPEWVEVYNASGGPLAFEDYRFCNRTKNWSASQGKTRTKRDTLAAYETVIFTRDTLLLREYLGFKDVRLIQYAMGYLNNTAGSLVICKGDTVIDSVAWDKGTVTCPSGFNPQTGRAENTPGYQSARDSDPGILWGGSTNKGEKTQPGSQTPFTFRLSTRVVRANKTPLRVYVESEFPVALRLLDSAGREQWKTTVPANSNVWVNVPLDRLVGIGVAYIALASGRYEQLVGILVRP
ncbi:Lamin Tail Domain [Fibrobacter sp. UWOV1]|uniref:lamin tail domain-containing protein n=1 Tax=Fibrobacter sp. UWOV1 TaxID=1896215 RepID=UPI00090FC841|nr:lamin tail domain-containing protein [Fibrobacter sp. UWOV1]SHK31900.1 Lamin Tail Domain [Fibrobacter sp. UWOV1]